MTVLRLVSIITLLGISSSMCVQAQASIIGPTTFAPGDYDNTANTVTAGPTPVNHQTTGLFRDESWWSNNNGEPRVGSGDYINQGNSLILFGNHAVPGTGPYTALNFTGPAISGGQSYLSIYDTTPADGAATKNVFDATQGLTVSADILFVKHSVSGGVVALYNEGQDALALLASNGDGNNPDIPKLDLVWQSPGKGTVLQSVSLPFSSIEVATWYRVTMELTVTGDSWTMNGTIRGHLIGTDPTSGLDDTIWSLSHIGCLSNPGGPSGLVLTNPGEVGVMAMGNESIGLPDNLSVSITNFQVAPEPATLSLLALGGLAALKRRRKS